MTVYVCFDKDIECGDRPDGWCLGCPKRGLLQVAVAPHAAAHGGPTAMRPATPEEHRWLRNAALRASKVIPAPLPSNAKAALEAARPILARLKHQQGDEEAARALGMVNSALGVALPLKGQPE